MEQNDQIYLASKLLKLTPEEIKECSDYLNEDKALYVSVPIKGGASLLVADDGSVLYAGSSVSFDVHLQEFRKGRRTPIEAFGE